MPVNEYDLSPYEIGSPEERAYQAAKLRGPVVAAGQVPAAWASMLAPARTDDQGTHLAIPGALTSGYNMVGSSLPRFVNWAANKAGVPLNIGTAPGAERAGEMADESKRWAQENVPRVMPQNHEEEVLADVAHNAAEFSMPGLGIAKAPKIAQRIAHIAVPGLGGGVKGAAIGAGLPVGIEGAMDYVHNAETEQLAKEMGVDPKTGLKLPPATSGPGPRAQPQFSNTAPPDLTLNSPGADLTQPDTSHTVAHPETGAPVNIPFPISSAQAATTRPAGTPATGSLVTPASPTGATPDDKYDDLGMFGRPDIKIKVPDFGAATGETNVSWGKAALVAGLGYAATSLAMRYGGKYLDPVVKTIIGKADEISNEARSIEHNQRVAAIDRAGISATGAVGSGADRGEAPLPGKGGYETTKLAQSLYDKNRVLTETAAAISPNSGVAKQWEARIGTINNQTPLMNRVSEMMYTGINPGNGGKVIPKLGNIVDDWSRAGADTRTLLEKGLYAGDELDTRLIKERQAITAGTPLNDEALRHNFTTTESGELRKAYDAMMRDPEAAAIATRVHALQKANIVEAYEMGRVSKDDMIKTLKDRPRQIPSTDIEGDVGRTLGKRDITATGWETPPTTPIEAIVQHYSKLYPALERNILNHDFLSSIKTWQDANPDRARIVTLRRDYRGKLEEPSSGPVTGRRITTYKEGVPHVWEVDNSSLYRALKNNMAQTNLISNIADITRRSFQSGTTGVMAGVLGGRAFAPISLNRNILQLANDRFAGTSFGAIDKGLQAATGGRIGSRFGLDPTQWAGSYGEALKGSAAVTGRAMSRALQNPNNVAGKGLRALVGDTWVDAWAKTLEHKWDASNAAMRRAEGVGGTGTGAIYDRPTYNIAEGKRPAYSSIADTMHNIYNPENVHLPVLNIPIPGSRASIGTYINVRNWMREIHREIAEGANSYYWKGMKNNPNITPEQRAYYTRHVLGDPSMSGSGAIAENMTRLIPWANPSIQDAVRMMRNIRDNPVGFAVGTSSTLAMTSAATILSAMLGGKKHINMLANLMSTHDRASNVTFFHDPTNEHNYTQFSLPQRLRMLNPIMLEGAAHALGTFNMHPEEDMYHRVVHALTDMFSHHVSHSTTKATLEGVGDFVDLVQAPPIAQAGLAAVGQQAHPPAGTAIMNAYEGKNPLEGMISKTDQVRRMHGQADSSSITSGDDTKWVHAVLSNIFGVAAHGMINAHDAYRQYQGTHDLAEATCGLLSNAGQSWRDGSSYGNMVWGNNMKMTQRNPMAEVNEQSFQKISHMPPATDAQLTGLTRAGGVPISVHGKPTINPDPQIIAMVRTVNNYNALIGRTTEPQITDIKKQIADVSQDPHWAAQTKRRLLNELVTKKNALESKKNEQIEKLNSELSRMAGGKRVNILTFDQRRGMDQFQN